MTDNASPLVRLCAKKKGISSRVSEADCFAASAWASSPLHEDTISLLTSEFWVRPVYEELLHASRFNLSPAAEFKRRTSNLVKIASHPKTKPQNKRNLHALHSTMTHWLGAGPVDFLNVWFPAHWAPLVCKELQEREKKCWEDHKLWFDAPAQPSDTKKLIKERADAFKSRVMHYQLGSMDAEGELPTLTGKLKVDWIDFPFDDIYYTEGRDPSRGLSAKSSSSLVGVQSRESPDRRTAPWRV